jgi:hypothetical protein
VKAFRRWLIYRRLLDELAEAPQCTLAELGVSRKALRDLAWHWADIEAGSITQPPDRHGQSLRWIALR